MTLSFLRFKAGQAGGLTSPGCGQEEGRDSLLLSWCLTRTGCKGKAVYELCWPQALLLGSPRPGPACRPSPGKGKGVLSSGPGRGEGQL